MKIKKNIFIILCFALSIMVGACKNAKKQSLQSDPNEQITSDSSLILSENVPFDTLPPAPGIRYQESRKVNSQVPIVHLNISSAGLPEKTIDLADYYSRVRYVQLKYPFELEEVGFFSETESKATFKNGSIMTRTVSSSVILSEEGFTAGDIYGGFYFYDMDGNYKHTLINKNSSLEYDKQNNKFSVKINDVLSYSQKENIGMIRRLKKGGDRIECIEINSGKGYFSGPAPRGGIGIIDSENYCSISYSILDQERKPFMYTFDNRGDTLCQFMNHNPLVEALKNSYQNPDYGVYYYFNDQLTLRQPYNDTIYRMASPSALNPAYVFSLGERKLSAAEAPYGSKKGKFIPEHCLETNDFLYLSFSEDIDTKNNRKAGLVKYFYFVYDKKEKKLYRITESNTTRFEDFILKNSMTEAIPLFAEKTKSYKGKLYGSYSKKALEKLMKRADFSLLLTSQQEKVKTFYEGLDEQSLLVIILE